MPLTPEATPHADLVRLRSEIFGLEAREHGRQHEPAEQHGEEAREDQREETHAPKSTPDVPIRFSPDHAPQ